MQVSIMVATLETKYKEHKDDVINLVILILISSVLGVYLIATTVLIAKDGVNYIERAQKLSSDPVGIIKGHPPGYPFLIFVAHKFVTLFTDNSSVLTWIYTAQSVTLLCRLIALIVLYFIGKFLVGSKRSFWAILILIILPYPAEFGSDALRDWPHILFLAAGFLLLLWGAKQGKWWMFGIAGLAGGLGHIIRPECAQLVIYGVLWLLIRLFLPTNKMNRPKIVCALFILLLGFAMPTGPYMKVRGRILPTKLDYLISSFYESQPQRVVKEDIDIHNVVYSTSSLPSKIAKAIYRLIETISDNLMYFFVPALVIGIYSRFNKQSMATDIEMFFVPVFIVLNVIIMILLYCGYEYIERRHCLSLVVCSIFYIPIGLQISADWLSSRFSKGRLVNNPNPQLWFIILVAVGVGICLPKLIRPIRIEKQGYRDAVKWLKENTTQEDLIAVPDSRIGFYAERDISVSKSKNAFEGVDYIVSLGKDESEQLKVGRVLQEKLSLWLDKRRKKYRLIIYEVL